MRSFVTLSNKLLFPYPLWYFEISISKEPRFLMARFLLLSDSLCYESVLRPILHKMGCFYVQMADRVIFSH